MPVQILQLGKCSKLTNAAVACLGELTNLEELNLRCCYQVRGLSGLTSTFWSSLHAAFLHAELCTCLRRSLLTVETSDL